MSIASVSVVIPTLGREQVLVDSIEHILGLAERPDQLVVVDQTAVHEDSVQESLRELQESGDLEWIRRSEPSIPAAMNAGLLAAKGDVVIFLDDDIVPVGELVAAHREIHAKGSNVLVAGQVLQPGESPENLEGEAFRFNSSVSQTVENFIGCNFSVNRNEAIAVGGFDEKFVGAAYRYESDFALRWRSRGNRLRFVPSASIHHLRAGSGGTRSWGHHLRTVRAAHSVGEYYFLLRHRQGNTVRGIFSRLVGSVATRHHLRRPWWIPATILAEASGLIWATRLALGKPHLLNAEGASPGGFR